jgi:glycosyltransferase involved in cell wall biosynthesis
LKVLYLCNIPSPYRVAFFNELSKKVELTVIYERKSALNRNEEWQSENSSTYKSIFLKGIEIGLETAFAPSVLKYLKNDTYDLIIIGGYSTSTSMLAIIALKFRKIPYVLNADGGFIKKDSILRLKIKNFFIGGAYAWLSSGKATSSYFLHYKAKKDMVFEYPFTSINKKDIVKNIVSADEKNKIKRNLGIKEDKIVLSVGQFIKRKGFDILLKSWIDMPKEYGLYIIGDKATEEYITLKNDLNLNGVHFVGFLDKEKLKKYYMASDLFVHPTREDIWGLVINEAMAYGLVVISTENCNAGIELVDNKNGFILPVEDIEGTNKAIRKVLSDEKLQNKMSKSSLKKINTYTIENMALRHVEIFNILLDR